MDLYKLAELPNNNTNSKNLNIHTSVLSHSGYTTRFQISINVISAAYLKQYSKYSYYHSNSSSQPNFVKFQGID